jgi:uncharacterized protein YkwD
VRSNILVRLVATASMTVGCGLDELVDTDLGDAKTCAGLATWPADSAAHEEELAGLVTKLRVAGTMCGEEMAPATGELELVPELRCAARWHAGDLARAETDELSYDGSDGSTSQSRANLSGYGGEPRYEILAADFLDAEEVLQAWIDDPQHCTYLMDRSLDHLGVGHAPSRDRDRVYWVLVMGEERE